MSGYGSGSYQQSQSEQKSLSEGPLSSVTGTIRGEAQNLFKRLAFPQEDRLSALQNQPFQSITPTSLNAMGLYAGQQEGFNEAVKQAVGRLSGNFANRGFLRPAAVGAIAGSAAQNVLPQFAPLIGQQVAGQDIFRQQLALAPEQVRSQRQTEFLNFLSALTQALGQQASSYGTSRSFGVSASGGGGVGGGGTE